VVQQVEESIMYSSKRFCRWISGPYIYHHLVEDTHFRSFTFLVTNLCRCPTEGAMMDGGGLRERRQVNKVAD